jgi:hypothetical protein
MLELAGANDKIQLVTNAAGDVDVSAHFMDSSNADPPVVKGSTVSPQLTTITTAATTDILAAPGASAIRAISAITVANAHATVANDVTALLDRSATSRVISPKFSLLPGEFCAYEDGLGWFKTGAINPVTQYVRKSSQQSFSSTSFADITGMGFNMVANGVYEATWDIIWRSATVTVGVGLAINGPASPVSVGGIVFILGVRAAGAITDIFSAGFAAYDTPNLTSLTTNATATDYGARISCLVENGATAGVLIPRWRSETATATTVEAGSHGTCTRLK